MKLETAKGTRDFYGEEEILKQEIIAKLKKTFELYGFNPLNTPILERLDCLTSKYAGGEEITKEIFKLKDQGKRNLGLRYDLTVPLARFVSSNKELKMPFKRYEMGVVFRDGPIKFGRYREFWQCDADIIGSSSMLSEIEILELAKNFFDAIKLKAIIKINNRKILDSIIEKCKIRRKLKTKVILIIDKLAKQGEEAVRKELKENNLQEKEIKNLFKFINFKGTNKGKIKFLEKELPNNEGIKEIKEILDNFNFVEFDISLTRGLVYYTSTVFEIYLRNSQITSSIAAGGRYDKMIPTFLQTNQQYPAVGLSFGLSVIIDALKLEKKYKAKKTKTTVYIIPINTQKESLRLAKMLRKNEINTEIDLNQKSITKNLDYANAYKIPKVIILGEKELKKKKYKLKNMIKGKEVYLNERDLIKKLKNAV